MFFKFKSITYNENYVYAFFHHLEHLQKYYDDRGIYFLFIMEPSKNEVYEEDIPDYIYARDPNYDKLMELLEEKGTVNYLNSYDTLMANKDKVRMYNKFYDPGHWTEEGNIVTTNLIVNKLNENGYNLNEVDMSNYTKEMLDLKFARTSNLVIDDKISNYNIVDSHHKAIENVLNGYAGKYGFDYNKKSTYDRDLIKKDYATKQAYLNDILLGLDISPNSYFNVCDIVTNDDVDNDTNLLFFRGSYFFIPKEKFYGEIFHRTTAIHSYGNVIDPEYFTNIADSNLAMFEVVQTSFNNAYFDYNKLKDSYLNEYYEHVKYRNTNTLDKNTISVSSTTKDTLIDLNIKLYGEYVNAYIKTDDKVYDLAANYDEKYNNTEIFTSVLKKDIGKNNTLIVNLGENNYTYDLNDILKKDL